MEGSPSFKGGNSAYDEQPSSFN
jgi:hypothetical protein